MQPCYIPLSRNTIMPSARFVKLYVPTMSVVVLAACLHWQAPEYVVYMLPFIAVTTHGVGRPKSPGRKTRGIGAPLGETLVGIGLLALVAHMHPVPDAGLLYWLAGAMPIVAFGSFFALHWEPKRVDIPLDAVSMVGIWCGTVLAPLWVFLPVDALWCVVFAAALSMCCMFVVGRRRMVKYGPIT